MEQISTIMKEIEAESRELEVQLRQRLEYLQQNDAVFQALAAQLQEKRRTHERLRRVIDDADAD